MLHSDVFSHYILPQIKLQPGRYNWDNLSVDKVEAEVDGVNPVTNIESCRSFCLEQENCVQYLLRDSKCYTSLVPHLGKKAFSESPQSSSTAFSGWVVERLEEYVARMEPCINDSPWVVP